MKKAEIIVRIAFMVVLAINLTCALQFIVAPADYVLAYQLYAAGEAGVAAIRGYGIVFLMWNATYPLFIWRPSRHMALGAIILVQQIIGCVGESLILLSLPSAGFDALSVSIVRFVTFDALGLLIMSASYAYLYARVRRQRQ